MAVLAAIALVPCAPVLVPELAGGAAVEVAAFRDAAIAAAVSLPDRWIAIGVGAPNETGSNETGSDETIAPTTHGTFAGYGRDIRIALSPEGESEPIADMPLSALFTGWLRGRANPKARAQVEIYAADLPTETALCRGRQLRAEIDACDEAIGVVVVADGANSITATAPGGFDPDSERLQAVLDDALASADIAALTLLPAQIVGRVAYQVLAGLAEPGIGSSRELARGAPYGVGYFVGEWIPSAVGVQ